MADSGTSESFSKNENIQEPGAAPHGSDEARLEAMLTLSRMTENSFQEIADFALNAAVSITDSKLGLLAFTSEDESILTLHAFSREAMAECEIPDKTFVSPLSEVGLWGEGLRQRRPVIVNDYSQPNPLKHGYPAGHVLITRHLSVPVFQGGRIVALAGVANKESEYTDRDARQLTLLLQEMWNLLLRKSEEEKLRESEERYRTIFENSMIGFLLATDVFVDCNEQACRMWGCSREEILGRSPVDFSPEIQPNGTPSRQAARERMQAAVGGEPQRFYWQHRRGNGSLMDSTVTINAVTVGGQKLLMAAMEDITERKRAEEERVKLETQMQHTQKLESLGVLAGGIAHDFNNMLMAILGNADLALMQLSDVSPARPMLQEIEKASRRAAELCHQMLAYSGKGRFVVRCISLSHVVEEMAHMLEVSISKKAILQYHFDPELPPIEADVTQVRQVIMNLIVNASEAIGDLSGVITITTGVMECDVRYLAGTYVSEPIPPGRYVFLEVTDTGCGMDGETLRKVFDPFFTTKFTGRGLGLAAVLGIMRGHKGAIKVYSEPRRGTTFKVLFPAEENCEIDSDLPFDDSEDWCGEGTVLVVDDEEYIRNVCRKMLEHMGLTVMTAPDGREALEVYKKYKDQIDCVILDLTMPHMDGEETFRELRRVNKDVKVIVSSGYTEQEVMQRFLGKGLAGFIQKPYQLTTLSSEIRKMMQ